MTLGNKLQFSHSTYDQNILQLAYIILDKEGLMQRLKQFTFILFITISVMNLTGCGQKGSLYLPDQQTQGTQSAS